MTIDCFALEHTVNEALQRSDLGRVTLQAKTAASHDIVRANWSRDGLSQIFEFSADLLARLDDKASTEIVSTIAYAMGSWRN